MATENCCKIEPRLFVCVWFITDFRELGKSAGVPIGNIYFKGYEVFTILTLLKGVC